MGLISSGVASGSVPDRSDVLARSQPETVPAGVCAVTFDVVGGQGKW